jgi:hypothetical protein
MSFVAEASRVLPVSAEAAFDRLADHGSWARWMPRSFRPSGASIGTLRERAKLRIRLLGMPLPVSIQVSVVRRPHEIGWRGGVPGLFLGDHRFLFEPNGPSEVRVRSVETWSGVLASLFQRKIRRDAEQVGRDQLEGLAGSFTAGA